jgi:hypothetical protein
MMRVSQSGILSQVWDGVGKVRGKSQSNVH